MNKLRGLLGFTLAVSLLLCVGTKAHADSITVSTSVPTAVIPNTSFGSFSISMYSTSTAVIYLMSYPEASTQTFANNGFVVGPSSAPTVFTSYHGDLYAESPTSAIAKQLIVIGGN